MTVSQQPPGRISLLFFGAIALLVIATLPYFVPTQPAVSDSYIFGYNNRAGIALFVLLAAVVGWSARERHISTARAEARQMPRRLMWAAVALSILLCYAMYRLTGRLNGFAESTYFVQRLQLMAAGRVPYRDFEFAYGAALLHLPLWTARLFHLSLADAYYVIWTFCAVLGSVLSFEAIRIGGDERQDRAGIYAIFSILSLFGLLNTGLNYVSLRFVLPVYFATVIATARLQERSRWRSSSLTFVACALLLLISPELAVGFALASLIYAAMHTRFSDRAALAALGALTTALAALFVTASAAGTFSTMRAFSAGGNNFPIYLSPSIAIYFAATCAAFVYVARRDNRVNGENAFFYWVLLGTMLIPAALGRCDFGHILSYGLAMLIAVGLLVSATITGRRWIRIGAALYILLVQVPVLSVGYVPLMARAAAYARDGVSRGRALKVSGDHGVGSFQGGAIEPALDPVQGVLLAPFAYRPNGWGAFESRLVESGYYYALTNVLTREQVQRKVGELQRNGNKTLLLPHHWPDECLRSADHSRALLTLIFEVPYIMPPKHDMDLYQPLCTYISANYHQVSPTSSKMLGPYELWAPNRPE